MSLSRWGAFTLQRTCLLSPSFHRGLLLFSLFCLPGILYCPDSQFRGKHFRKSGTSGSSHFWETPCILFSRRWMFFLSLPLSELLLLQHIMLQKFSHVSSTC